jgi:hypothetical protein
LATTFPASPDSLTLTPGLKVRHAEFDEGIVTAFDRSGYVKVFFRTVGEKQVSAASLLSALDRYDEIVESMQGATPENLERLCLVLEAWEIPLMESAATLTSAKVDLLPHQIVLVHRIANARPKRFLIADEVGLWQDHRNGSYIVGTRLPRRIQTGLDDSPRRSCR